MTGTTNARLAGFTYLFYIAVGISSMLVTAGATAGVGIAAKLASVAGHAPQLRIAVLLDLLMTGSALVLGVALYGITRDEDHDLALLAFACRVCEGLSGALGIPATVGLLWLATAGNRPGAPDAATVNALGAFLLMPSAPLGAIFFVAASTIFCYLLLRGRIVPAALAWLGLFASILLLVALPLQLAGLLTGIFTSYMVMWMPMLVFEITIALWLLIKGAASPARLQRQ